MTIIVTGATGHLGRLAVEHLLARGVAASDIVAAGRNAEKLAELDALGVRTATIDFADPASLDATFTGADALVLVSASEPGQRLTQHTNAIEAAKRAGVARIVYTSAPQATTSALVLAPDHKATEELITASGVPFTILRNNWYNENYAGSFAQAVESGVHRAGTGEGRVASASRSDYAEAIAAVLTSEGHLGKVYELSGDSAWNGEEFAAAAASASGRPVEFVPVSFDEQVAGLKAAGLDEGTASFVATLDANIAAGTLATVTPDLVTLIGHPTTPLVDYFRSQATTA
ncbi:SDR family oxidoreductase [Herbiconiux sp.]|uniref:SDR family oxidoreductase n=1 Tax=Herbiconiux sp. TaxID=1871186 RepID=UPI0025BEEAC0|nr:SDR family oxidoreductase [Herbiconiux sp.]